MYLVVGLGNPGKQYEATRHNMGFDTIDVLVERHKIPQGGVKFNAMYGSGFIGGEKVIFMKPLSFMNLSGGPVQEMAAYFKINPESELIIIQDDIDLEPGQLRIRKQGSAGGHNGLKSIDACIGTNAYPRLRCGIGHDFRQGQQVDYVLGEWLPEEKETLRSVIGMASEAVLSFGTQGVERTMNLFNKKGVGAETDKNGTVPTGR